MQVCFNSTAIVDDTNQEPTESFMLVITATDPMNDLIVVDPSTTTITIIDNDGKLKTSVCTMLVRC